MSGNTGLTQAEQQAAVGISGVVTSRTGKAAASNQIQVMTDSERAPTDPGGATGDNKVSEVLIRISAVLTGLRNRANAVLGTVLDWIKASWTITTTDSGEINRRFIEPTSVASLSFQTGSPYVTNDLASLGTAVSVSYDLLGQNRAPAMDNVLGVVAAKGIVEVDNAGTGNNTGASLDYQRITLFRQHIPAWRNGSTSPVVRYGVRGDDDSESPVIHFERAASGNDMFVNYQRSNGTAARFEVGERSGRANNAAHFQLGETIEIGVENHLANPSAANQATPLVLVVTLRVLDANGNQLDEIEFNDTPASGANAMRNASHFDFGRVQVIGGDASQNDQSPTAYVETWQNKTGTGAAHLDQLLHHSQLSDASSHPPTDDEKLGGFWHSNPVSTLHVPATIEANNLQVAPGGQIIHPAWVAGTMYQVGSIVDRLGVPYFCKTAHTASADFADDSANWTNLNDTGSGGNAFPDTYRTDNNSGAVTMLGVHVDRFNAFTASGAVTFTLDPDVGTDGQLCTIYASGAGGVTIDNPLTGIPDITIRRYDSITFKRYTVSNFSFWIHIAVARYEDQQGSGSDPTLPSTVVNRTNTAAVTVPAGWVGNINNFNTGHPTGGSSNVSGFIVTLPDTIGDNGDFITFRNSHQTFKVVRSGRTGNPTFGILADTGEMILRKVGGQWEIYKPTLLASQPVSIPFIASSVTNQTLTISSFGQVVAVNSEAAIRTRTLPSNAWVGWWCIVMKDGGDNNYVRVQVPTNHNFVGRDGSSTDENDFIVNATQDYIDLEYNADAMLIVRANSLSSESQGWWQPFPLRFKRYDPPTTRRTQSLTATSTNATADWIRQLNAITTTVANRSVVLPGSVGKNGDLIVIGNAGSIAFNVTAAQWDGTGTTNYSLAANDGASFRKANNLWFKA